MTFSAAILFGDDRLRQRDTSWDVLLFGMATVPDTHSLQTTLAKTARVPAAFYAVDFTVNSLVAA